MEYSRISASLAWVRVSCRTCWPPRSVVVMSKSVKLLRISDWALSRDSLSVKPSWKPFAWDGRLR
ncbi:hypothetical protein D3C85_742290 [compost metagenome]